MPSEIEHKYLVLKEAWKPSNLWGFISTRSYLSSIRNLISSSSDRRRQSISDGQRAHDRRDATRIRYPIPIDDAATMLEHLCERPLIEKTRYREEFEGHRWEIDEFHGDNSGLNSDCGDRACQ